MENIDKRKLFSAICLTILILALPISLVIVKHKQETRSHAATANNLEIESGLPNALATTKTDSQASGGSYVQFNNQTSPTPSQSGNDPQWSLDLKSHMTSLRNGTWSSITAPFAIPHDGVTSSSTAFNNWIAGLPQGTKAIVPSGWTLVFDGDNGLNLKGKTKLQLILTGVNIRQNTTGVSNLSSAIFIEGGTDIIVDGGTITGQMNNVGSNSSWVDVNEHINGVIMRAGSKYVEINGLSVIANRSWPIFMAGIDGSGALADGLWVHNFTATGGESSVALVAGQNALIENSIFSNATYFAIDIEPDTTAGTVQHVLIQNNTFDGWGLARGGTNAPDNYYFFAANPGQGTPLMDDYIVRNNTIPRAAIGTATGQGMRFHITGPVLRSNVVITGNVSNSPRTQNGGGSDFNNVNNLTVTGNTQKTVGGVPLVETDTIPSGAHIISPNNTQ